ncbi:hypothetical protein [Sulfitobacter sp. HGT1]|uniref:hypothetical protein n=1 Tax=Sulfitobacter sp. HGT1 TaxID=2735435 RepID=UPI001594B6D5|nr:hypothetical protein [Sulfitobacter sp. HGT1]
MRPAANLIGFYLYPWGWDGREFKALTDKDKMPYEDNIFRDSRSSKTALRGRKSRRTHVQELLFQWTRREEIKWNLYGDTGSHSAQSPRQNLNLIPRIYINESILGRHNTVGYQVTVDALSLIDRIMKNDDTRGAKSKYDAASIEEFLREQIESCSSVKKVTLINSYLDHASDQSATGNDLPSKDTVGNYVDDLWAEYKREE